MLFRDDKQAALNLVETLCQECAGAYAAAATQVKDAALAAQFQQAHARLQQCAAQLAPHIRALGDLPNEPDPDRETVENVVERVRNFLTGDADANVLAHRIEADHKLQDALVEARGQALHNDTLALLDEIATSLEQIHMQFKAP